jgi:acetyl-CoA synthetase
MADFNFPVPESWAKSAWIDNDKYLRMYEQSIRDPEGFWGEQAKCLDWFSPWKKVKEGSFGGDVRISWFSGGKLNVSHNCLDRHMAGRADQIALIWEGDDPTVSRSFTYRQLHQEVCEFANVLKSLGLRRGDRVTLYLPMIPELAVAMLACTRIGVVHSIVFGGFSPESLADRIRDCQGRVVITADEGLRGGKTLPSKENTDKAVDKCPVVEKVILVRHTGGKVPWMQGRDLDWDELMEKAPADCPAEEMDAEDPLFILYTSGSTGKPKGVLHTTAGYFLFSALTHKHIFDYHDGDIYWCTADIGWVTGHSYIIYGPLANGATTVMFEGVPNYPDWSRFWNVVDKHRVSILYTAPTAIRALMRQGDEPVKKTSRKSLRLLGTVGEPINPEAWLWYYNIVGEKRCPIVDTWWQTETGGILISPLPGAMALKPGSASRPYFGVKAAIVDAAGNFIEGPGNGNLVITEPWPGMLRTIYGDHKRFLETYFSMYKGVYFTGDGARRDEDGDYWITGRVDDVINVSGHRLGTAEVESALAAHPAVAEAAVVGFPHEIKGQGIYAYVTVKADQQPSEELLSELQHWVIKEIGAIASPDFIQWAPGLPKTRSGKIMRRILRKIAANSLDDLGDTSTLAEPAVVEDLIRNRPIAIGK